MRWDDAVMAHMFSFLTFRELLRILSVSKQMPRVLDKTGHLLLGARHVDLGGSCSSGGIRAIAGSGGDWQDSSRMTSDQLTALLLRFRNSARSILLHTPPACDPNDKPPARAPEFLRVAVEAARQLSPSASKAATSAVSRQGAKWTTRLAACRQLRLLHVHSCGHLTAGVRVSFLPSSCLSFFNGHSVIIHTAHSCYRPRMPIPYHSGLAAVPRR